MRGEAETQVHATKDPHRRAKTVNHYDNDVGNNDMVAPALVHALVLERLLATGAGAYAAAVEAATENRGRAAQAVGGGGGVDGSLPAETAKVRAVMWMNADATTTTVSGASGGGMNDPAMVTTTALATYVRCCHGARR